MHGLVFLLPRLQEAATTGCWMLLLLQAFKKNLSIELSEKLKKRKEKKFYETHTYIQIHRRETCTN